MKAAVGMWSMKSALAATSSPFQPPDHGFRNMMGPRTPAVALDSKRPRRQPRFPLEIYSP